MISYWKTFRNLSSLLRSLTYLSLLNSFLFLSRFSASLKSLDNYFFRLFVYKSLFSRFSVLISYNMWPSKHFSISSCFPCFQGPCSSGSRFFRVRVQGPSPGFRSSHFLPPFNYSKYVVKASCTDLYNNYQCNENERRIQGPAKHLRWSVLPKYLTPSSRYSFLQTLLLNSNIQILWKLIQYQAYILVNHIKLEPIQFNIMFAISDSISQSCTETIYQN